MTRFTQDWEYLAKKCGYACKADMLRNMYLVQNLSLSEIGTRLGCSGHSVARHLNQLGVDLRMRGGPNNFGWQTRKLFRLDQRVVLYADFEKVLTYTGVSSSVLYKFRKSMEVNPWSSAFYPR